MAAAGVGANAVGLTADQLVEMSLEDIIKVQVRKCVKEQGGLG